jgi:hypothetical protein
LETIVSMIASVTLSDSRGSRWIAVKAVLSLSSTVSIELT